MKKGMFTHLPSFILPLDLVQLAIQVPQVSKRKDFVLAKLTEPRERGYRALKDE